MSGMLKKILSALAAALLVLPNYSYAALSLDGHNNNGGSGNSMTLSLTTTQANDIIVVHEFNESASFSIYTVSNVTDTYGLPWAKRSATTSPSMEQYGPSTGADDNEIWWAPATSTLSNDTITITLSGSTDCASMVAFGVNGANTSNPWDSNASLPSTAISVSGISTPSVSGISTTNTNAMIVGFMGSGANGAAPGDGGGAYTYGSGYTGIDQNIQGACALASGVADEYKIVSTPQSNISAALGGNIGGGEGWFMVGDAIIDANQPSTSMRVIRLRGGTRLRGGVRLE